jgi:hypothetical protein
MWFNSMQRAKPYQLLTGVCQNGETVADGRTHSVIYANLQVLHGCRQLVS